METIISKAMKQVKAFKQKIEYGFAKLGPQFELVSQECPIAAICCKGIVVKGDEVSTHFCEHLTPPFRIEGDAYIGKCNKITE